MRSTWQLILVLLVTSPLRAQDPPPTPAPQSNSSGCDLILKHPAPRVSGGGRLLHKVAPKYPKAARRAQLQGSVRLSATIAKDGNVKDVTVLEGDPILAAAAAEAVKRWRYEPYRVDDAAVEITTEIAVSFKLDSVGFLQNSNLPAPLLGTNAASGPPTVMNSTLPYPVYESGSGIQPPKATFAPNPTYAESARKAKKQGNVALGMVVTPEGNASNIEVCRSLDPALDRQAVETVSHWKFEPATKDGKPVAAHIRVDVSFRLY
jgi:TonB family protein